MNILIENETTSDTLSKIICTTKEEKINYNLKNYNKVIQELLLEKVIN